MLQIVSILEQEAKSLFIVNLEKLVYCHFYIYYKLSFLVWYLPILVCPSMAADQYVLLFSKKILISSLHLYYSRTCHEHGAGHYLSSALQKKEEMAIESGSITEEMKNVVQGIVC